MEILLHMHLSSCTASWRASCPAARRRVPARQLSVVAADEHTDSRPRAPT